ncbi:MAG: hypothetical protein M0P31_17745 [Solirubrobacteraceae bacterium]|nr:hypothetical protein [Solirubrobacteraceae bacterium]
MTFVPDRGRRPTALVVLVALLLALTGPLAMRPASAQANVCDSLGPLGGVCGEGTAVAGATGAVRDVAGGAVNVLGDVAKLGGKAVKGAVELGAKHTKALAAAGLAVGTWAACGPILKRVGNVPAITGPAGVAVKAGAKASGAVCRLVRKGGKKVLAVGAGGAASAGKLAKLAKVAKLASGAAGLAALLYSAQHGSAWVLTQALDIEGTSGKALTSTWIRDIRSNLNGVAGVLLVLGCLIGAMFAALSGRISDAGRLLQSLIGAAFLIGLVGSLMWAGIVFTDEVTNGIAKSDWGQRSLGAWNDLGDSYANVEPGNPDAGADSTSDQPASGAEGAQPGANGTPPDDGKGPWLLRLVVAAVTMLAGLLVAIQLQVREGALVLLLLFSGVLLASYAWPRLREIGTNFGMLCLGVIVAKPVMILTLLAGGALAQTAGSDGTSTLQGLMVGCGLLMLAAFAGWWVVGWLGLHGAGAIAQVSGRGMALTAGAMALGGGAGRGSSRDDGSGDPADGAAPGSSDVGAARSLAASAADRAGGVDAGGGGGAGIDGAVPGSRLAAARAREAAGDGPLAGLGQAGVGGVSSSTGTATATAGGPQAAGVPDESQAGTSAASSDGPGQGTTSSSVGGGAGSGAGRSDAHAPGGSGPNGPATGPEAGVSGPGVGAGVSGGGGGVGPADPGQVGAVGTGPGHVPAAAAAVPTATTGPDGRGGSRAAAGSPARVAQDVGFGGRSSTSPERVAEAFGAHDEAVRGWLRTRGS